MKWAQTHATVGKGDVMHGPYLQYRWLSWNSTVGPHDVLTMEFVLPVRTRGSRCRPSMLCFRGGLSRPTFPLALIL